MAVEMRAQDRWPLAPGEGSEYALGQRYRDRGLGWTPEREPDPRYDIIRIERALVHAFRHRILRPTDLDTRSATVVDDLSPIGPCQLGRF